MQGSTTTPCGEGLDAKSFAGLLTVELARLFRVAPTTVKRWINGESAPHEFGQQSTLAALRGLVPICPACNGSGEAPAPFEHEELGLGVYACPRCDGAGSFAPSAGVPTPRVNAVAPVDAFVTDSDQWAVSKTDYDCLLDVALQLERELADEKAQHVANVGHVHGKLMEALACAQSASAPSDWNAALDLAADLAMQEWIGENSLAGSKAARKIADRIRDHRRSDSSKKLVKPGCLECANAICDECAPFPGAKAEPWENVVAVLKEHRLSRISLAETVCKLRRSILQATASTTGNQK